MKERGFVWWRVAQEAYVGSRDMGKTGDEVEKLRKRHEAFENSTGAWEERFSALERLTRVRKLVLCVCGCHLAFQAVFL